MASFGYTLMTEQSGPRDLVAYAVAAEQVGLRLRGLQRPLLAVADRPGPRPVRLDRARRGRPGHQRVELATYVTCPIIRYHPAVVAQKAATLQLLSDGRFILGLGSGENLNEHVTGEGWPPIDQRQDMLVEAATIIRELHTGELITWEGDYFRVDSARIWDAPDGGVPIAIAVSGEKSIDAVRAAGRPPGRRRARRRADQGLGRRRRGHQLAQDRPDPDLLGPGPGHRGREGARPVPLVRRRLGGQRRSADPGRLRGGEPVRPARGRRRDHPLRPGPRRDRRGGQAVRRRRLHRHRRGPGRRRGPVRVPGPGRRAAAEGAARELGRYPGEVALSADFPTLVASHHGVSRL